jgi:hypothetical protein
VASAFARAGGVAGRHRSAGAFSAPLPHGALGSMPAIEAEHTGHVHRSDSFASIYARTRARTHARTHTHTHERSQPAGQAIADSCHVA